MCNWSEYFREQGIEEGRAEGRAEGREKERIAAIERMMKANATKEQIISYGYTEDEFAEVESHLYTNA